MIGFNVEYLPADMGMQAALAYQEVTKRWMVHTKRELFAVVRFALDSLGGGKKRKGMVTLVAASMNSTSHPA